MDTSKSKEKILERIQEGLKTAKIKEFDKPELANKEIFVTPDKPLVEIFRDELTNISGQFYFCNNHEELIENLKAIHQEKKLDLCYSPDTKFKEIIEKAGVPFTTEFEKPEEIKSGVSGCEYLVARFGSVLVSSALPGGRRIFPFPEIHIVIAHENQLVLEIEEALDGVQKKYGDNFPSQITNITGPSRTADIEKTLILGAHGPKQLIVFVLKS
jgi:L-lactate dehydrogenase complex protein LldG